ncbi:MAG TPA: hypothetical protein ENJ35_01850 [Gammaproteobacteria bacterium]|nr:hypothetical protein [Gammaproteobacteria bacterium]
MIKKLLDKTGAYKTREQAETKPATAVEVIAKVESLPPPANDQLAQLLDDEIKTPPSLINRFARRLRNPWSRGDAPDRLANHEQDLHHRLEIAFEALHRDFDEREKALQKQLAEAAKQYEQKIRRSKWLLIPAATLAAVSLGYIFYMVSMMGGAMNSISTDITTMNSSVSNMGQTMTNMSSDTHTMVGSIQNMDHSMRYLNQNMGAMNQNVGAMNHNVAAMNRSIAPIGNMARPAGNFMGAMKSFMPF